MNKNDKLRAYFMVMNKRGFFCIALLRFINIVPFILINYIVGATELTIGYNVLSLVGNSPMWINFTYVGASLSNISEMFNNNSTTSWWDIIILVLMIVFICGLL